MPGIRAWLWGAGTSDPSYAPAGKKFLVESSYKISPLPWLHLFLRSASYLLLSDVCCTPMPEKQPTHCCICDLSANPGQIDTPWRRDVEILPWGEHFAHTSCTKLLAIVSPVYGDPLTRLACPGHDYNANFRRKPAVFIDDPTKWACRITDLCKASSTSLAAQCPPDGSPFGKLPTELLREILLYLSSPKDLRNLQEACPNFDPPGMQLAIRRLIIRDYPFLSIYSSQNLNWFDVWAEISPSVPIAADPLAEEHPSSEFHRSLRAAMRVLDHIASRLSMKTNTTVESAQQGAEHTIQFLVPVAGLPRSLGTSGLSAAHARGASF
ncbi:hypothetical protein Micbo1qcDRAFT_180843 [Microdochium bolleyi]|uniref:F-box domain-containing protein n=1 Tax=Microdochium bolleyi TaxID=196109 RepID=A0A136IKD3_9PEZI|nr:hypothetical protein Micbo1qcDRAFT_180843 [Microdochium bolleyi]